MCGIAGVLTSERFDPAVLTDMAGALHHRGPDDSGTWCDLEAGIGLAHRRLAIVDLSSSGHQPMQSASGRFLLCFNGEIYNHAAIRARLTSEGASPESGWQGHSDTETLLQAIEAWGVRRAIDESVGMFAFAAWDRAERRLHLARDRFGEKPLYYGWSGRAFLFGSELKSFSRWPGFAPTIDRAAISQLLSRGYIGAPASIYRGIFKLPPASILTIDLEGARAPRLEPPIAGTASDGVRIEQYWSYEAVVRDGLDSPFAGEGEALDGLDNALRASISGQSLADVPVGAFLSGGIDSSSIVALYQAMSSTPVRTYTIGFREDGFDEAKAARQVAEALGTVHHEHYVGIEEARAVIPLLPAMYDEPFADSSQIPTYLVSKFARGEVTVALTGDGGDELLGGYNRHVFAPQLWRRLEKVPPLARRAIGPLRRSPLSQVASLIPGRSPERLSQALSIAARASDFGCVYAGLVDQWHGEPSPVLDADGASPALFLHEGLDDAVRLMHADAVDYLPGDILCKVDRASMAVSLETRVPFLDHRVAAVAARIPLSMKIEQRTGKVILRRLLGRYLPTELFERPKSGFAIPIGKWIKGPLRDWAEDLLDRDRMNAEGWLDAEVIHRRWRAHLNGRRSSTEALWGVLMFQAWLREQQ